MSDPTDKRKGMRFPMAHPLRFETSRLSGSGETVNIGPRGLLCVLDGPVAKDQRIHLCVDWPVLLNGDTPLQLVIGGEVLRTTKEGAAIRIRKHEFRTRATAHVLPKVFKRAA